MRTTPTQLLLLAALCWGCADAALAQEIYVANYEDGVVSVLDATTLAPIARIPVSDVADPELPVTGYPSAVVFSADHALAFVSLSYGSHVAVIDTAARVVVDYIEVQPVSFDALIFLHPSGRQLYVTSCADPVISVVDVRRREMTGTIRLSGGTYPMAFSRNGQTGYAGNGYADCGAVNGIHRLNLARNTSSGFIPTSVPVADIAIFPLGGFALASGGNRIVVVDLLRNREAGAVRCGPAPCTYSYAGGIAFNATGTRAYMVDFHANTLSTIDTNPFSARFLQELSRVPVFAGPGQSAWQVKVGENVALVTVMGFPGHVIRFDISADVPVPLTMDYVGSYAYELDMWTNPPSADACGTPGRRSFEELFHYGLCVVSAAYRRH
jgi:YVTN family beta-propeller protein